MFIYPPLQRDRSLKLTRAHVTTLQRLSCHFVGWIFKLEEEKWMKETEKLKLKKILYEKYKKWRIQLLDKWKKQKNFLVTLCYHHYSWKDQGKVCWQRLVQRIKGKRVCERPHEMCGGYRMSLSSPWEEVAAGFSGWFVRERVREKDKVEAQRKEYTEGLRGGKVGFVIPANPTAMVLAQRSTSTRSRRAAILPAPTERSSGALQPLSHPPLPRMPAPTSSYGPFLPCPCFVPRSQSSSSTDLTRGMRWTRVRACEAMLHIYYLDVPALQAPRLSPFRPHRVCSLTSTGNCHVPSESSTNPW